MNAKAKKTRILSPFQITESALGAIKKTGGLTVDLLSPDRIDSIAELIEGYDALIVSDSTTIDGKIITAAKKLEAIFLVGTGLDNIDLDCATSRGILVMSVPLANTVTTAEHTISMLMALSRNIPQATASMKEGKWEKKKFTGTEVLNKVLGIVGLGRIGRMVADRARGFGMRILVNDPLITEEIASRSGGELVDMERLVSESDYITIHTPKMKRDEAIFTRELFSKMKPGIRIINLTGGGVLREDDLLRAIDEGIVSGAALDVFETEPPDNKRLLENERVILTPHLGGDTEEAYEKTSLSLSEQLIDYYRNGIAQNPLNFPSLGREMLKTLDPFVNLGEKLGSFMGQIIPSEKISGIEIGYLGKVEEYDTSLITLNILKGLLSFVIPNRINLINAPVMAREYGIEVEEGTSASSKDYSSEITVSVSGNRWKRFISGAIVGNRPRIVRVDNYFIETIPEGIIILVANDDLPGVVGNIGTSLGFAQVNIGRMQLARDTENRKNLILISVDSPVEDTILDLLRKLQNVNEVRQIEL